MELSAPATAKIQEHLAAIAAILAQHDAATVEASALTITTWVAEHLVWAPGNRVNVIHARQQLAQDTGLHVSSFQLARYVPWARQRSNGSTYYRDVKLLSF
jgi:hypothetical protein